MRTIGSGLRHRVIAVLASALVLALTVSCARSAWQMPDGIVTSPADRGKLVVGGIYPSTVPNDASCCWVQRNSRFRVEKSEPATDLAIEIFLPDIVFLRKHPQGIDVTLDGAYRFHKCCFGPGDHTVFFTLPHRLQDSVQSIDVALSFTESFVPAKLHWRSDERSLAAILLGATPRQL
jgi:hypothetical protein